MILHSRQYTLAAAEAFIVEVDASGLVAVDRHSHRTLAVATSPFSVANTKFHIVFQLDQNSSQ